MSVSDISDNVRSVKCVLGIRIRALRRARHFALVESLPCPTKAGSRRCHGINMRINRSQHSKRSVCHADRSSSELWEVHVQRVNILRAVVTDEH